MAKPIFKVFLLLFAFFLFVLSFYFFVSFVSRGKELYSFIKITLFLFFLFKFEYFHLFSLNLIINLLHLIIINCVIIAILLDLTFHFRNLLIYLLFFMLPILLKVLLIEILDFKIHKSVLLWIVSLWIEHIKLLFLLIHLSFSLFKYTLIIILYQIKQ